MSEPRPFDLPFQEAVDAFRRKVRLPTARWTDLWQGEHAAAFTVAGATRDDVLASIQEAVQAALDKGESFEAFQKRFRTIVDATGWRPRGPFGWRARLIYRTNLGNAYAAGRYQQATDPDMLTVRPYWRYRHGGSADPRPEHLAWDGLILPADDPWWEAHYPPNGWGCSCYVEPLTPRQAARAGGVGTAPPVATRPWTSPDGVRTEQVPEGIDPGWAYNPGEAAVGRHRSLLDDEARWQDLPAPDPGPLPLLPLEPTTTREGPRATSPERLRAALRSAIGGDTATLRDPTGSPVRVTQAIVDHMLKVPGRQDGREAFFPFLREVVEAPAEVWVGFARREDGKIGVRRRYVRYLRIGKDRVLGVVADARGGHWTGLTTYRGSITGAANLRRGRLAYRREDVGT